MGLRLFRDDVAGVHDRDQRAHRGHRLATIRSQTQVFDGVAWTVPTIVGNRLYVRDNKQIVALDLG